MSLGHAYAMALNGSSGTVVEIEVDLATGLPGVHLIGLPDRSLAEATDRVKSALTNSGFKLPPRKLTVNLSPASLPKHGSGFDVAIALGCLSACGVIRSDKMRNTIVIGELALDGRLRTTPGVLAAVVFAKKSGFSRVIVPAANVHEATLVPDIEVSSADSLAEAASFLGAAPRTQAPVNVPVTGAALSTALPQPLGGDVAANDRESLVSPAKQEGMSEEPDLADVYGQREAVRSLIIAATGGHHIFLQGPPGVGKTMLASRLPSILPNLTVEQALEVACVRSLSAVTIGSYLPTRAPFEAPHHTITVAAMVGGGVGQLKPGVAARANLGVLFLDEATEFSQQVLDTLRQPLESGELSIQRGQHSAHFASRFQLVMAANPCPCGNYGTTGLDCECAPMVRRRYAGRISGPLRDRIDIQIAVAKALPPGISHDKERADTSEVVRARVESAREKARARWSKLPWHLNAHIPGTILRSKPWRLAHADTLIADRALDNGLISMRGYDRILRVAWSVADLEGVERPTAEHVAEAFCMRTGKEW